ncbi:MAG: hypothetical protein IH609_15000 [Dehalococcoidia bacterium]|nr:hypothetical protein [Dehalococcoidia bacterium]
MARGLAFAAVLAFVLQAAWLLMWPLPSGPFQAAATIAGPSALFFLAVLAYWWWRKGAVAQPLLGAALGTLALWILVLVRNDAHEVGTFGAIIEGAITGGLYTLLGGGAFLVLARSRVNR